MPSRDPTALLNRKDAARALTEAGYVTSETTLATKAVRGGGPAYRKFGPRVLYQWSDLLEWAQGKTSVRITSTSDARMMITKGR